jgi:hypothetical protein
VSAPEILGHVAEGALVGLAAAVLLLAWRDRVRIDLADQAAALLAMCAGFTFGVLAEAAQFLLDWVRAADLQHSNAETMLDLLWTNLGAVLGAVLAVRGYCHWLAPAWRAALSGLALWLFDGPSRVLDRWGWAVTLLVAMVALGAASALWFTLRPGPGMPLS